MSSNTDGARCKRKNLTSEERAQVVAALLRSSVNLQPPKAEFAACAVRFSCSERQIARLWQRVAQDIHEGKSINYSSGRKGKSGRKSRLTEEFRLDLNHAIALTPLEDRTNIRTLADSLGMSKSTLHDYFLSGVFRCHTACLKPMLSDEQRVARVRFASGFVQKTGRHGLQIDNMMEYVHLDEKWFYLAKEKQRFYLAEHEEDPHTTVKNKNYIVKVMFLVAVARPRWDPRQHKVWDGKIGLWPFAIYEPAERSSKNRPAGTLELKTYAVTRDIYRQCLCRSVIPCIKALWPSGKRVILQHDNAKPHVAADDPAVLAACAEGGWRMRLQPQPANSPDFNALDLGFFSSIQSLQHKKKAKTIEDLVNNVDEAFKQLHYSALDRVFVSLQSVLMASMDVDGSNKYAIPHLSKATLTDSRGLLPQSLACSDRIYQKAINLLSSADTNRT